MPVDIGFLEENNDKNLLKSHYFPSKVGGHPAWLSLKDLPTPEDLKCITCSKQLIFLCQIYAPYEENPKNFHRTIFLFTCRNSDCCKRNENTNLKVYRSQLERRNDFYDYEPPNEKTEFCLEDFVKTCALCGGFAEKHCSKCKNTYYCCRDHQILDWRSGHKIYCQDHNYKFENNVIFPEFELVIEEENISKVEKNDDEKIAEYEKLVAESKIETLPDVSEVELDNHVSIDSDKTFLRFKKRIEYYPDQVLRYDKGGDPLFIAEHPKPTNCVLERQDSHIGIPNCEFCGSERQFEFQILPQLLYEIKEDKLDWGTLLVYTCKKSCENGPEYKNEYIFKQDVSE